MTMIIRTVDEWRNALGLLKAKGASIGFVPTMGALHLGHRSLVEKSCSENDVTVVSIFVNPTQFNDPRDLEKYPVTLESDLTMLESVGCDYLFLPRYEEIYCDGFNYVVSEKTNSKELCGASRPGHFEGVLTVVLKLLNIISADKAYFGEKDFQQYLLIKEMCRAFFLPTQIVSCPTVRGPKGLALSSRNQLLNRDDHERANMFNRILKESASVANVIEKLKSNGFEVDYVTERWNRRFGAVKLGGVRLIDNVEI